MRTNVFMIPVTFIGSFTRIDKFTVTMVTIKAVTTRYMARARIQKP